MNRRWNWALPLVLLVIGAMFLAACGGDDDDAAGDDGGATATATAEGDPTGSRVVPDEPFRVDLIEPPVRLRAPEAPHDPSTAR